MADIPHDNEILSKSVSELQLEGIDEETFRMALGVYPRLISARFKPLDDSRFEKIPRRFEKLRERNEITPILYGINSRNLFDLTHWLYKRCQPDERNDFKTYHEQVAAGLEGLDSKTMTKPISYTAEALATYNQHESLENALRHLQNKLPSTNCARAVLMVATLILSVANPISLPFFSPELASNFHLPNGSKAVAVKDYAPLYQQLTNDVKRTVQRLDQSERSASDVEKVAYTLFIVRRLKESYYEPCVISRRESLSQGIFKAVVNAERDLTGRFPQGGNMLLMKEQSILGDRNLIEYLNEVSISSQVQHNNLIAFHGWTLHQQHLRIVMDRMEMDLEKRLGRRGIWITDKCRQESARTSLKEPIRQLFEGLQYLHDLGITHRDIKPQNIFLDAMDNIKLGDFGVSRVARNGDVTTLETFTGTHGHMAPEVLRAENQATSYTDKADIWALGCVIFRMIFGYPLFTDNNDVQVHGEAKVEDLRQRQQPPPPQEMDESEDEDGGERIEPIVQVKSLDPKQYEFLWKLLHSKASKRFSAKEALDRCQDWNDYGLP
ncbi:hypothetical protein G7054_g8454 [Neopestalotiopsis clavispora]|nr:hypothetical protein G7054_g8454 [Neopestalotiopsis clavispora]